MTTPYLIVVVAGDSNCGSGQLLDAAIDVTNPSVVQLLSNNTIQNPAAEALENGVAGDVGSTLALCRLLAQRGNIPAGYNVMIISVPAYGTSYAAGWDINGTHPDLTNLINRCTYALGLDSRNRIWFFDWNFGYNEQGAAGTYDVFKANMITLWTYIRANVATASRSPMLMSGVPPDFYNLGFITVPGLVLAQQTVGSWLDSAAYVDPTAAVSMTGAYPSVAAAVAANGGPEILHSYIHQFIHFSSASHRGGTNNALRGLPPDTSTWFTYDPSYTYTTTLGTSATYASDGLLYISKSASNTGNDPTGGGNPSFWTATNIPYAYNVVYPLSERKYTALLNLGWRFRAS